MPTQQNLFETGYRCPKCLTALIQTMRTEAPWLPGAAFYCGTCDWHYNYWWITGQEFFDRWGKKG